MTLSRTETTFTTIIQTHSSAYPGEDLAHETNSDADDPFSPSSMTLSGGAAVRLPQPEYDLTGEGERVRAGERWVEQLAASPFFSRVALCLHVQDPTGGRVERKADVSLNLGGSVDNRR